MRNSLAILVMLLAAFIQNLHAADATDSLAAVVDINSASAQELADGLPGIGPAKAARIVKWREQNGTFTHISQLQEIKGIGPKTVEKLRKFVRMSSEKDARSTRLERESREEDVRADIRKVMVSARLAAQPEQRKRLPVKAWYRRSMLEILRAH